MSIYRRSICIKHVVLGGRKVSVDDERGIPEAVLRHDRLRIGLAQTDIDPGRDVSNLPTGGN
jgi:hypothetical protein